MRIYDFSFNFVTYAMIICFSKMTSGICCDVQRITQPLAKTTNKGRPLFFSILEYTHEWKPINLTKDVLSWMKNLKFGDKFISLVSQTPCFTVSPLFSLNDDIVFVWRCQYFPQHASHRRFQFCSNSVFVAFMSMWPWVSLTPHTLPPSWKVTILSSSSYMYCICIFVRHSKYKQDQKCNLTTNPN